MKLGVSYIAAYLPLHLKADMQQIREMGCSEVLVALQENHFITLNGGLRFSAQIAKDQGIRPFAVIWGYANTFGGGRMSGLMLDHPDMWRKDRNGKSTPMACLNNHRLVQRFTELSEMCRNHGFEGIFIDEPTPQECFCANCQKKFYDDYEKNILECTGKPEYEKFRQKTVKRYTEALCKEVKKLDKNLVTITCIMPWDKILFEDIASIDELDVFGSDPYWINNNDTVENALECIGEVSELAGKRKKSSQAWISCWKIPAGREEEIYSGGKRIAQAGCDSLYTWSFHGGLGTNEECDNPGKAWESIIRLYKELC